jgi:hypothetical protein
MQTKTEVKSSTLIVNEFQLTELEARLEMAPATVPQLTYCCECFMRPTCSSDQ